MNRANGGLLVASLLGACGGDGRTIQAADFPAELQRAWCGWEARCSSVPDVDSCVAAGRPEAWVIELASGVEAGTIGFHPDSALECLEFLDELGCTTTDERTVALTDELWKRCRGAFTPSVGDGGACAISGECMSDACVPAAGCSEACCAGTCGPTVPPPEPVPIGGECASTRDCVEGASCQWVPLPTCQPRVGEGGPCDSTDACRLDLTCVNDQVTAPHCAAPAAEGESCEVTICGRLDDTCSLPDLTCRRKPHPGESCGLMTETCVDYAECMAGVCVAKAMLGEPCGGTAPGCFGLFECTAGLCTEPPERFICLAGG